MAVTVDSMTTKYKLLGKNVSKTFAVDEDYFVDDGDNAEQLTNDIKKVYDTDVTITGFAGIVETKYSIGN